MLYSACSHRPAVCWTWRWTATWWVFDSLREKASVVFMECYPILELFAFAKYGVSQSVTRCSGVCPHNWPLLWTKFYFRLETIIGSVNIFVLYINDFCYNGHFLKFQWSWLCSILLHSSWEKWILIGTNLGIGCCKRWWRSVIIAI